MALSAGLALFTCTLAFASRTQASLVMFGDSLSDDGNGANPV